MSHLVATVQSLRDVREACKNYLMDWALEEMTANAQTMSRIAKDVSHSFPVQDSATEQSGKSQVKRRVHLDD